jgi:CheY-like chemotaxis protein
MEGSKKKILIVDDDTFLLDMYALKFSQNGFEVHTAENGADALEKLKGDLSPDIILLDVLMPEMDGFEMLEKMNAEKICPEAVRIVLSNKSDQADVDRGSQLGVQGYIIKANSTPTEVISQVMSIVAKKIILGK